jgi:hypothetical protein
MTTLYLDVCCLNRPFDDQRQARIRLEADAVILILEQVQPRGWKWMSSEAVDMEVERILDLVKRQRIQLILNDRTEWIAIGLSEGERAGELVTLGFSNFDALHVACAEHGRVDIFLTTDDRLVKLGKRHEGRLKLRIENILKWFEEVSRDEYSYNDT